MNYAIKYPTAVSVEKFDMLSDDICLSFRAGQDKITVVMTMQQASEFTTGGLSQKSSAENARQLYIDGAVEIDTFERELDRELV